MKSREQQYSPTNFHSILLFVQIFDDYIKSHRVRGMNPSIKTYGIKLNISRFSPQVVDLWGNMDFRNKFNSSAIKDNIDVVKTIPLYLLLIDSVLCLLNMIFHYEIKLMVIKGRHKPSRRSFYNTRVSLVIRNSVLNEISENSIKY